MTAQVFRHISGPGSGKTHTLLTFVSQEQEQGLALRDLTFCSFTRSQRDGGLPVTGLTPGRVYGWEDVQTTDGRIRVVMPVLLRIIRAVPGWWCTRCMVLQPAGT